MNTLHPVFQQALAPFVSPPKFAATSCSQCGTATGPGNAGHSTCATHKPRRTQYHAELDTRISGIPCGIYVGSIDVKKGDASNDASDWDHSGWTDIEFTVLDSKGYPAPWLQAKLTDADTARIEGEIMKSRREEA